jgi:membrane-bound lytic murein transglycosylase B
MPLLTACRACRRFAMALMTLVALVALVALAIVTPGSVVAKTKTVPLVPIDGTPDVVTYGQRDDVVAFARQAAEKHALDADWAIAQLAQARYLPVVARLVMPPPTGTAKNWEAYRARFVEPQRIREGLRWWQANEAALAQAEARWGVPADIVTAIVGVETFYGRVRGNFKVIDALATLAFDFPTGRSDRSGFYRDELETFLRWCAAESRDPQSVKGSFAGAMGLPQFMPSSLLKYAIDFDGDGRIDLDHNGTDVVGSVAHYFAQFGWQRDLPTHYEVTPPTELRERALLLVPDILPSFTAEQFAERGAALSDAGRAHDGPLALVELQNGEGAPSYVAGTRNFYVVTRYNWSSYYAMAVIELARAMRQMRPAAAAPAPSAAEVTAAPASAPEPEPELEPKQAPEAPEPLPPSAPGPTPAD